MKTSPNQQKETLWAFSRPKRTSPNAQKLPQEALGKSSNKSVNSQTNNKFELKK